MGTYDTTIQIDDLACKSTVLDCFDTSGAYALVIGDKEDYNMGPFDDMFDANGDGSLDAFERANQMDFLDYMSGDGLYKDSSSIDDFDSDFGDDW